MGSSVETAVLYAERAVAIRWMLVFCRTGAGCEIRITCRTVEGMLNEGYQELYFRGTQ